MLPVIGLGHNLYFSKLIDKLEKATSHLKLEPDWPTILSICDLIRQGDVAPKNALSVINKKITHDNPHTSGYGLLVLESCVKNCGSLIHDEVCTKQYMEQLKEIAKTTQQDSVRTKILELIQAWAYAFRDVPKYRAVQDAMRIMKAENFDFQQLQERDAMFTADNAPDWVDGDKCHWCETAFGTFNRKHHCRACGQVFCAQCSGKTSTLPKYGIEKKVRVCDTCYDQVKKPTVTTTKETDLPAEYLASSLAQQQHVPPRKTDEAKSTIRWQNKEVNGLHQASIRNKNTEFEKQLAECQLKRKMDYHMNNRKSEGLPLFSSDEEDSDNVKKEITTCQAKQKEGCVPHKSTCLTKELQQAKEQRLRLDSNIQQLRASKHDEYMQTNNNAATDLKKCSDKNCECCKKSEGKDDTEEFRISKRLPYEIRKLVESKQRINNKIEDIRKMKQEQHYANKKTTVKSNVEYKPEKWSVRYQRDSETTMPTL